jgi:RNA polymerase sigma factor (TIGR02999 family)
MSEAGDVTRILNSLEQGQAHSADDLLPLVYEELRKLAAVRLAQERAGQSLQATALVHDAWLRLVDVRHQQRWDSRGHFFAAAAEAMRRILVERARRKGRVKHGGEFQRVDLPDEILIGNSTCEDVLALDEALTKLEASQPEKAQLVKLRFFAGLTIEQTAESLGISNSTADRQWTYARAWLFREISGKSPES